MWSFNAITFCKNYILKLFSKKNVMINKAINYETKYFSWLLNILPNVWFNAYHIIF